MAQQASAARRRAVRDFKRAAILDAAKAVFSERGLDGASIRSIASAAGYTPGAIYLYFPGKEHVYAEILSDSLSALGRAVKAAAAAAAPPARPEAAMRAFFDYYRAHPDELDLGFYLFNGIRRRGLTPELDRQLNGRLIAVLRIMASAILGAAAIGEQRANLETVAAASHLVGILLMENSGRLKALGFSTEALVEHEIAALARRLRD